MTAAERWAGQLADWAIPDEILGQAPTSPWDLDARSFVVDESLDRSTLAAEVARAELPTRGGSVLDVGCGGGRAALALVPPAELVIGVDESHAMLMAFAAAAETALVEHQTVPGRWPEVAAVTPTADVVTCHHVAYNVADIVPFVDALTEHARRTVVLVLSEVHPRSVWNAAWKHFWQLERPLGPTASDFVDVLTEIGLDVDRWQIPAPGPSSHAHDPEFNLATAQRVLCLRDDRRAELAAFLDTDEPDWVRMHDVLRWSGSAG